MEKKVGNIWNLVLLNLLVSILFVGVLAKDTNNISKLSKNNLTKELKLEAEFKEDVFNEEEPITLLVTLRNSSDDTIILLDSRPIRIFDMQVKRINGSEINLNKESMKRKNPDIVMGREMITLKPGEKKTWQINLNYLFDINLTDEYVVDVKLLNYYRLDSSQKADFTLSNSVTANTVNFKLIKKVEKQ